MRSAFGFLTVLGGAGVPDRRTVVWFPVVGVVVGGCVGLAWSGAATIWPPLLAAVVGVAVDAALTGMLHLDGLADSADGLLPSMGRERRLAVMSDPNTGAFAVVTVVLVLALRVGAMAAMDPEPLAIAGIWAGSRSAMAVILAVVPYARPEGGLATAFAIRSPLPYVYGGLILTVGLTTIDLGFVRGVVVALALAIGAAAVVALARRRLGGFTGDVLGAAGVVGETCALLALAARP